MELVNYFISHHARILELTVEHLEVTGISVLLAIILGVPIGIAITKNKKAAQVVLYVVGVIQTIPSIALFGFLIPFIGIGLKPAVVALVLYGQLSIIRNVYAGIANVSPVLVEAARGMGMTGWQILFKVQIPAAFTVILAGVRTATVTIIGIATIAAYIGAGGLGDLIFRGIATLNFNMVLAGAIPVAVLSLGADFILGLYERHTDPMYRTQKGSVKEVSAEGVA